MNRKQELTMDDFIAMEKLELKYYSSEHVTPHEEAFKWHMEFPDAGVVLEDQGRVIAFIDLLPIKSDIYEGIMKGSFNDKYLTTDHIVKMENLKKGDRVNLLLSCILVDDNYRKTDALNILLKTQMDYYRIYHCKGIFVENVITSNVTEQGERFSERMGFQRLGVSEHGTALYTSTFEDFLKKIKLV